MKLIKKNNSQSNAICVIGAGRFGSAVITQLIEIGKEVVAVDKSADNLKQFKDEIDEVVILDAADIKALKAINIQRFETVVVAVANIDNIEIVSALLELKVVNIIARASTKRHARVLRQMGANIIVNPEQESGTRTAVIAANENFALYSEFLHELVDDFVIGFSDVKNPTIFDKPIKDLNFPAMGVTVVLVRRNGQTYQITGDFVLKENDQVSIVGKIPSVNSVFQWLNSVN